MKLLDFGLARLLDLGYGNVPSATSAVAMAGPSSTVPKAMAATIEFTREQAKKLMSSPMAANLARGIAQIERNSESDIPTRVDPLLLNAVVDGDGEVSQDLAVPLGAEDTSELAVSVSPDLNQLYRDPADGEMAESSRVSEQHAALISSFSSGGSGELSGTRLRPLRQAPSQLASQGSASGSEPRESSRPFALPSALDSAEFSAQDWGLPPTSERSRIAGTPLYMAPEIWRGEPGTRRADIYSMGALLYELLHGVPPFADVQLCDLAKVVNEQDAPPLLSVAPTVDARMAAIVDRCLRRDPMLRFGSGDELREALEHVRPKESGESLPEGNPYRGLLAFEAEHRGLFFGRRSEIGTITERLRTEPLVLVAADSGVGKSSLCRAGVLPMVSDGALGKGRQWSTLAMVPGRTPLTTLCAELAPHTTLADAELQAQLGRDPAALARTLHRSLGETRGLLLFIDQLEEIVTIAEPAQSRLVGEALGHLCSRIPSVRMLMTVRSDFLARVAAVGGLGDELVRALYILRPLTPDKIQEAIVGPAHIKGVSFESQELVETLVESTAKTDGGLPLLQFALTELWEARKGDSITKAALDAIGGVSGALARHADQVMLALPADQRKEARRILMALVTMEGTRARKSQEELPRTPAALHALEALVKARLLVARDTGEGASYEVAHEALLKGWDSLRKWLEDHAERRAAKQRLATAATEWTRLGKTREALWSKLQITDSELLEDADITPREAEFLAASRRKHWRDRQLRRALAVIIPSLLVALYGGYRIKLSRELSHRVEAKIREGHAYQASAERQAKEYEQVRQASLAAFDERKQETAEKLWDQGISLAQDTDDLYRQAGQSFEAAITLDAGRTDVRTLLGDVLLARALLAERERSPSKLRDLLARMMLYDLDGSRQKKWQTPGTMSLKSNPSGAHVTLSRYVEDKEHRFQQKDTHVIGDTPITPLQLEPGSYLLAVSAADHVEVKYPLLIKRSENQDIVLDLPELSRIPAGYVYIPPGKFLFGTSADDVSRRTFFSTVPSHTVGTSGYLISKYEISMAQWLEYLDDLPLAERTQLTSGVIKGGLAGAVGIKSLPNGGWELTLQPVNTQFTVRSGEKLTYPGRKKNSVIDWLRLPAMGVNLAQSKAFAAWLARSGRVPGAHICTEIEWERAARGADEREFPHATQLSGQDANIDETYERNTKLTGPDEIGSHPTSASPFGVEDMAGNVFEWTLASVDNAEGVVRSGGYYYAQLSARSTNRTVVSPDIRDPCLGIRICAPYPPPSP